MTDPVKEQLSACLDGELPEAELSLLLKQLQRDPHVGNSLRDSLRDSMGRYSLIGEAMRGPGVVAASRDFADRVAAAIDAEAAPQPVRAPIEPQLSRWLRPAAGLAIAAGVAAVAVIALQPAPMDAPQIAAVAEGPADTASYTVPANVDSGTTSGFIPAARLTNYVVAHSEYSSPLGRRTVLSGVLADDQGSENEDLAIEVSSETDAAELVR